MSRSLNRRELLLAGGAAWIGAGALSRALGASQKSSKKVLFFTKSAGFPHPVVNGNGGPGLAERTLSDVGKEHGFDVVVSKDGRLLSPIRSANGTHSPSTPRAI
jgi:hypothetical protein